MISTQEFGVLEDGRKVFAHTMANPVGMSITAIDYGCIVTSICVPDRYGHSQSVVLALPTLQDYVSDRHYTGCIIGRFANRISNGRFNLANKEVQLSVNSDGHHLHGGWNGLNKKLWNTRIIEQSGQKGIEFFYHSPDGEEGYPGAVDSKVQYFLGDDYSFQVHSLAVTDQPTVINLTQHHYFNLGSDEHILGHQLCINALHYLETNNALIPTGRKISLQKSSLDLTALRSIRDVVSGNDPTISRQDGMDHYFILDKTENELSLAATLLEPASGRMLEMYTTSPGLQVYTSNIADRILLKEGRVFQKHGGICLEPHNFPDAPNHPDFPSAVLMPGKEYRTTTVYRFNLYEQHYG